MIRASYLILFAILISIGVDYSFAENASVSVPQGTSVPGCEITNECFIPFEITVNVGDKVTWSNDDSAAHIVTSGSSADGPALFGFDSRLFMSGTTYSHTFDRDGTYPYFCTVHPWMEGIVTVQVDGGPEPKVINEKPKITKEEFDCPVIGELGTITFKYNIGILTTIRDSHQREVLEEYLKDIDYKKSENLSGYVNTILESVNTLTLYFKTNLKPDEEQLMIQISEKYVEYLKDGRNKISSQIELQYSEKLDEMNAIPMKDSRFTVCDEDLNEGIRELEKIKKENTDKINAYDRIIEDWEENLEIKKQDAQEGNVEYEEVLDLEKTDSAKSGQIGLQKGDWVKYKLKFESDGGGFMGAMLDGLLKSTGIGGTECAISEIDWQKIEVLDVKNNEPLIQNSISC
ncbi:MAG TPA: plastocyanin/azurin family copper-binding protein, partial [Nitrosopumilaceae archaeon]|nr:plastocyanin/azurin family copper-binding protein [Nitrosopumilaceae archaeon]